MPHTSSVPSYETCKRLQRYRDGQLFHEWNLAVARGDAFSDKLAMLKDARRQLARDVSFAASDWSAAGTALAATAKIVSDMMLDFSGPIGQAARATVAPLDALVSAVVGGRVGESGSGAAMREVIKDEFIKKSIDWITHWNFVAGGLADLANNTRTMISAMDGWTRLRDAYARQLANLDRELATTEAVLKRYRSDRQSLLEVQRRIDAELQGCSIYRRG
jgi:hypothetical protein